MDTGTPRGPYRITHVHVLSVFAIALGVAIGLGGDVRWNDPRLAEAQSTNDWWAWAAALIAYGVILLATERWEYYWAVLLSGAVPYSFIVISFIQITQVDPTVAYTGVAVYGLLWTMHVVDAVRHGFYQYTLNRWVSKRLEQDRRRLEKLRV